MRSFRSRIRLNHGPDFEFNNWSVIQIHEVPKEIIPSTEIDFWCSNGKDMYLLTIRKSTVSRFGLMKAYGMESTIHLLAEWDFSKIDQSTLMKALKYFFEKGIPRLKRGPINIDRELHS